MENLETKPIASIPGALARSDGTLKLPETEVEMPNGGTRIYKTKWVHGRKIKASKGARHQHYGLFYKGKNYKVHRLICEAFHGPFPEGKHVVLHRDENSLNNEPSNLRWGSQKENMNAPGFVEYCKSKTGKNSNWAKHRKGS